jgi:hypothetical protein
MKWVEIISLRTAGINEEEAREYMNKFCRIVEKYNLSEAHAYAHSSVPGDLALVITSETQKSKIMGTDMGQYIADALKQFGLVDYNCWLLMDAK